MFCLDANVIIGVMTRRKPALDARLRLELQRGARLVVPVPVLFELRYGADKSEAKERNHARIDDFLVAVPQIASFDAEDACEAAEIRAFLESQGLPIGPFDYLIAAQARRRGAALVTLNRVEFDRIPGLLVTDWGGAERPT